MNSWLSSCLSGLPSCWDYEFEPLACPALTVPECSPMLASLVHVCLFVESFRDSQCFTMYVVQAAFELMILWPWNYTCVLPWSGCCNGFFSLSLPPTPSSSLFEIGSYWVALAGLVLAMRTSPKEMTQIPLKVSPNVPEILVF